MDYSPEQLQTFVGKPVIDLPTPSLILSHNTLKTNCDRLLSTVKGLGIGFRAHVKTLKSIEVTRMMLGQVHHKVVASTLREIRGLLPLVDEGIVDEILYGLPCVPSALPQLQEFRKRVAIILMVDHESQIEAIEKFSREYPTSEAWSIFIKVDMGSHRAGVTTSSPRLAQLISRAEKSASVSIYGFYCHAGHSYACKTPEAAAAVLNEEISAATTAASLATTGGPFVLSIGATPTLHVIESMDKKFMGRHKIEIHGGNFPCNDLQQVATGSVKEEDQAMRILSEVCSIYPERNEAIVNAGVIALAREAGPSPGFARATTETEWNVGRLSQEHGILVSSSEQVADVASVYHVGQKILLYIQHACITAAAYGWYFVVDENDVVQDVWYPWKGW